MLERMRCIVLQDVAEMMLKGRRHFMHDLPVFQSTLFSEFKRSIQQAIAAENPLQMSLAAAIPLVAESLRTMQNSMDSRFLQLGNQSAQVRNMITNVPTFADFQGIMLHYSCRILPYLLIHTIFCFGSSALFSILARTLVLTQGSNQFLVVPQVLMVLPVFQVLVVLPVLL